MPFMRIPAGSFFIGSGESIEALVKSYPLMEQQRLLDLDNEAPVHAVLISHAFYMGLTEVTVGQCRRFIEASGYRPESEADGTGGYGYNPNYDPDKTVRGDAFEGRDRRYSWRDLGFVQSELHPVVNITWHDAHALAAWLSSTK